MIPWLKPGNTAVITGGANGIGFAAAKRYLENDMRVVIADVDETALADAAAQLDAGNQLETHQCDVALLDDVQGLKAFANDRFGHVHCLMNNAGAAVTRAKPWEDTEGWHKQLQINLWGVLYGCQTFIPDMLASSTPVAVINTGSKQGITNPPGGYAYNLSKAGVVNYTQSLAHGLREEPNCPISTHLLIPGFTYSNMIARFIPEQPPGAWSTDQVIDYMVDALARGDFYILCPDNDTPPELDAKRMQWNTDDLIKNRPALSRWHADYAEQFSAFMEE